MSTTYAKVTYWCGIYSPMHWHEPHGYWQWPWERHRTPGGNHRLHGVTNPVWVEAHVATPSPSTPVYHPTDEERALYAESLDYNSKVAVRVRAEYREYLRGPSLRSEPEHVMNRPRKRSTLLVPTPDVAKAAKEDVPSDDAKAKILSRIGTEVHFRYPGDEGAKQGILRDRAVNESSNTPGVVPYWDVVDLIEFKDEEEPWIRIGYYRKPKKRLNWGSQTTITEPISVWKTLLVNAAGDKKWFRDLLEDVMNELANYHES